MPNPKSKKKRDPDRKILGTTRKQRYRIYLWGAVLMVLAYLGWSIHFLRPASWYRYTDQVAFEQVARDVEPGFVIWESAAPEEGIAGDASSGMLGQPSISADGARMIYSTGEADGNADLFLRRWDGTEWGEPRPMRALNSGFHETSPALSADGSLLFFSSDRPGGRGGKDIWVARWDGAEYAWPLPLTDRVNTPFDEVDPEFSPDGTVLYFASNRPRTQPGQTLPDTRNLSPAQIAELKADFDLHSADIAGETPFEVIVDRHLSMLYSLREGALADPAVMAKLGGSKETEAAIDKALAYLASKQSEDGRWDLAAHGGGEGHDVAATAFALLAYYGRGECHDTDCRYRDTVARGLKWLLDYQNPVTGDLRGENPRANGMYDHGIGTLALVEAYGVTKDADLRSPAMAAIDFIAESQHEQGGWRYRPGQQGDLSVSGWMIMALASAEMSGLPVPEKTRERAVNFMEFISYGTHGGRYGYVEPGKGTAAMNAAGFFCSQLLGATSNSAKAYESAAMLETPGFRPEDIYHAYYGTVAACQHQGPVWRRWREQMHKAYLEMQAQDGSWTTTGPNAKVMGPLISTALTVLCLEAHYRYTPLYGLGFEPDPAGPAEGVANLAELPQPPMFRHAKHLAALNSPADDRGPFVTDHGDFLYFASSREGGFGGSDIYRSRISGGTPTAPQNLGPEINSEANESDPAVRMAGFHLLFNSDRNSNGPALFSSRSHRVERLHDYSKIPDASWLVRNIGWIAGLLASLALFVWLGLRARKTAKPEPEPAPQGEPLNGGAAG